MASVGERKKPGAWLIPLWASLDIQLAFTSTKSMLGGENGEIASLCVDLPMAVSIAFVTQHGSVSTICDHLLICVAASYDFWSNFLAIWLNYQRITVRCLPSVIISRSVSQLGTTNDRIFSRFWFGAYHLRCVLRICVDFRSQFFFF